EARLVTTGTDETTGEPVVEVTHEALIRGWPELRGWIDEDRDRLRAERRLSDAAAEWDPAGATRAPSTVAPGSWRGASATPPPSLRSNASFSTRAPPARSATAALAGSASGSPW